MHRFGVVKVMEEENVISSSLFSASPRARSLELDTCLEHIFKSHFLFPKPSEKETETKWKQNNFLNPHLYCSTVRFDVILSYTHSFFGWMFAQFQSHHRKKLRFLKRFWQMCFLRVLKETMCVTSSYINKRNFEFSFKMLSASDSGNYSTKKLLRKFEFMSITSISVRKLADASKLPPRWRLPHYSHYLLPCCPNIASGHLVGRNNGIHFHNGLEMANPSLVSEIL